MRATLARRRRAAFHDFAGGSAGLVCCNSELASAVLPWPLQPGPLKHGGVVLCTEIADRYREAILRLEQRRSKMRLDWLETRQPLGRDLKGRTLLSQHGERDAVPH